MLLQKTFKMDAATAAKSISSKHLILEFTNIGRIAISMLVQDSAKENFAGVNKTRSARTLAI